MFKSAFRYRRLLPFILPIQESYIWQASQLVAEHELQEKVPPIGLDTPSVFLEKEAKEENIRSALL